MTIADALSRAFAGAQGERLDFDVCDYGAGFGDLSVATLCALERRYRGQASFRIDVVDSDLSLLAYATTALQSRGYCTRKLTPHAFDELQQQRYDLILASHVLYYVGDRPTAIANLARKLRPGGQLAVVLRAESCDTYLIRSAVRQAPGVVPPEPRRPRLHVHDVEMMLQDVGLRHSTKEIVHNFAVPVSDVRSRDLYSHAHTTDATEFIRFVGHIPTTPTARRSAASKVEEELAKRRRRDTYVFRIATAVVTGVARDA